MMAILIFKCICIEGAGVGDYSSWGGGENQTAPAPQVVLTLIQDGSLKRKALDLDDLTEK